MEEAGDESQEAFRKFMKGGPCYKRYDLWTHCIDDANKSGADALAKCRQMTALLQVCLEMNPHYYAHMMHLHAFLNRHNATQDLKP